VHIAKCLESHAPLHLVGRKKGQDSKVKDTTTLAVNIKKDAVKRSHKQKGETLKKKPSKFSLIT